MSEEDVIELIRQAIMVTLEIGAPVMVVGLVVGVLIALVQALTQIQEITLVFVPKIVAIMLSLFVFFPLMISILISFTETIADKIVGIQ